MSPHGIVPCVAGQQNPQHWGVFEQQQLGETHCEVMYPGIILYYRGGVYAKAQEQAQALALCTQTNDCSTTECSYPGNELSPTDWTSGG